MSDTLVAGATSSRAKNYVGRPDLIVRNTSGDVAYSYILTRGLPSGSGLVISSAVLRLYPRTNYASSTINLHRVTSTWSASKVTWNSAPTINATAVGTRTGTLTKNVPIEIDITAAVQSWVSGTANYGVRVSTTATTKRDFHSANATGSNSRYVPQLVVTYSFPPATPTNFTLTGGARTSLARPTTTWVYKSPDNSSMASYQIQTNTSDSWTSGVTTSAEIASTSPTHTFTSDIAEGATLWYRVRHKSTAGRWSNYSAGQEFGRSAKVTVNVTAPTAAATSDPTPTTTWSVTGGTQQTWRVTIVRTDTNKQVADSGWKTGTENQWAPSAPIQAGTGVPLQATVHVIDTVDRVETPGDPISASGQSGVFTIGTGSGITAVSGLTVAAAQVGPSAVLSWTRATGPDSFTVERVVSGFETRVFTVEAGDAALGGSNYRWTDTTIPPRHSVTYTVRAVENGVQSAASSTVTITTDPQFIWITDPNDPSFVIPLADADDFEVNPEEDSATFAVLGSNKTIVVAEGTGRLSGSVSGSLFDDLPWTGGATARQMRSRVYRLRNEPTNEWRLVVDTWNLPVVLRDVTVIPRPGEYETFGVSCEWYAQGELPWETGH